MLFCFKACKVRVRPPWMLMVDLANIVAIRQTCSLHKRGLNCECQNFIAVVTSQFLNSNLHAFKSAKAPAQLLCLLGVNVNHFYKSYQSVAKMYKMYSKSNKMTFPIRKRQYFPRQNEIRYRLDCYETHFTLEETAFSTTNQKYHV